jgi:hypothetical protein
VQYVRLFEPVLRTVRKYCRQTGPLCTVRIRWCRRSATCLRRWCTERRCDARRLLPIHPAPRFRHLAKGPFTTNPFRFSALLVAAVSSSTGIKSIIAQAIVQVE